MHLLLKALQKIFPTAKYTDQLDIAVIKRRNSLSFNAGYASELPERDVPQVLVLNFFPIGDISRHIGFPKVIADAITFAGGQFGRMDIGTISSRNDIINQNDVFTFSNVDDYISYISNKKSENENDNDEVKKTTDFIVYGTYNDRPYGIDANVKIMNLKTGVVVSDFNISDTGKNYLTRLSYRIAKRIYESIPYKGRILQCKDGFSIVNLGSFDGLKKDEYLFAYFENDVSVKGKYKLRKKILFKVDDVETDICKIVPVNDTDANKMSLNMEVFPLRMKRAVRIK